MTIERIARWLEDNPVLAPWVLVGIALVLNAVVLVARNLIARGLVYLAQRSKTRVDDILVKHMRPYRFAWLAPLLLTYYLATWVPQWTGNGTDACPDCHPMACCGHVSRALHGNQRHLREW